MSEYNVQHKTSLRKRLAAAKQRARPEYRAAQKIYGAAYRKRKKKTIAKQQAEYVKRNAVAIRLKRKGLNPEFKDRVHNDRCDICGDAPDGRWKTLTIDHDHKTGRFRGMLCSKCNCGLGYFRDEPKLLKKAIEYLQFRKELPNEAVFKSGC